MALGDSYTAGPLINLDFSGTVPIGCAQSKYSYPYLVAASLHVKTFRNPSCSGSTTKDFAAPQDVYNGPNPPEYDSLGTDTTLVTIGIGGNDIGLVGLAVSCINVSPLALGAAPLGASCAAKNTAGGVDTYGQKIQAFEPKMEAVLAEVHRRAPNAKVFVVGYPAVLPEGPGCWPYVPLTPPDNAYVRDKVKELNTVLAQASAGSNATYVDTWTPTVGHDACKVLTNDIDGLVVVPLAAPLHPNQAGEAAMADAAINTIQASRSGGATEKG